MGVTWLLDVDGVVNVLRDGRQDDPRLSKARVRSGRTGLSYTICWRPRLLDDIRRATRFADVRWASTWCDGGDSVLLGRRLGLDLPCAFGDRPLSMTYDEQKINAALHVLDDGDRLIWTDDRVVPVARRLYGHVFDAAEAEGRALLIAPDKRRGITNREMALIKAFTRTA